MAGQHEHEERADGVGRAARGKEARCFHGRTRCAFCWGGSGQRPKKPGLVWRCGDCGKRRLVPRYTDVLCERCKSLGVEALTFF